jgi:hypothetical protein
MFEWILASILFVCTIILYSSATQWEKHAKGLEYALKASRERENRYKKEIEISHKALKETSQYKSNKRLEDLERYIQQDIQDTAFIATFEVAGMDSIESQLDTMFRRAERERSLLSRRGLRMVLGIE